MELRHISATLRKKKNQQATSHFVDKKLLSLVLVYEVINRRKSRCFMGSNTILADVVEIHRWWCSVFKVTMMPGRPATSRKKVYHVEALIVVGSHFPGGLTMFANGGNDLQKTNLVSTQIHTADFYNIPMFNRAWQFFNQFPVDRIVPIGCDPAEKKDAPRLPSYISGFSMPAGMAASGKPQQHHAHL